MFSNNGACGTVLVVDDDRNLRTLLATSLADAGYEPVTAATGDEALALIRTAAPRLAILDVNLPGMSGYELCRRIKEEVDSRLPIVFLSGDRVESFDRVAGLLLGADDYMVKPFATDELMARIRGVLRRSAPAVPERMASLTKRELEVLRLLAHGSSQKEIADALVISPKTVGTHIEHILEKLGVRSRSQAIALAYREDLVSS
jgi:DNA-binding NarL/FixJ family response regulator